MSTYAVRPDSVVSGGGAYAPVSDNSDTTFIIGYQNLPLPWIWGTANPTIAAGEFIDRVTPYVRISDYEDLGNSIQFSTRYLDSNDPMSSGSLGGSAGVVQCSGLASTRKYTPGMLNDLRLYVPSIAYDTMLQLHDIWAVIETQKVATAVPTGKTETLVTEPVITVTTTADIDAWQASFAAARTMRVELDVKQAGVSVASGTASIQFSSTAGVGRTLATTVTLPSLGTGTYSMYARVGRQRTLHTGEWEYGAWSSAATLTMNTTPPSTPTIDVTADGQRMALAVTLGSAGQFSNPVVYVERLDGTTWTPIRNTGGGGTFGAVHTYYDYEAPRGVAVSYRVRNSAVAGGIVVMGAWSATDSATIPVTGWNIKCPENPALNMIGVLVTDAPDKLDADRGVFRPLAASTAVVVSGPVYGLEGSLSLVTRDATEDAALEALVRSNRVLMLESCWGWSRYIRVTSASERRAIGTGAAHEWSFDYVQTEVP